MSIIRVGLAETKNFADGYDRIFGKKEEVQEEKKDEQPKQGEACETQKQEEKK